MRLDSLKIRGLGPFSEVDVDLAALDARLIAITGGNGEGKSTLLELFAGALYRRCATRGKLSELATTRDAFVEASIVNGAPWTIRQLIDGTSGKGEATVIAEDGTPALESGKVRDYDRWADAHLPPEEVLYSTIFSAQGSAGFLELKPADRKAVLLRVLGIEHLETMADLARTKAKAAKNSHATLQARLEDERRRGGDVGALSIAERGSVNRLGKANIEKTEAAASLKAEDERAKEVDRLLEKSTEHAAERRVLDEKRAAVAKSLDDLQIRIENNRDVLSQADAIREAVERDAELVYDVEVLHERQSGASDDAKAAERLKAEASRRADDAQKRVTKAKARLADREKIEGAVAEVDGLRETLLVCDEALATAEEELDKVRGRRIAGAEDRISDLRFGLSHIQDHVVEDPRAYAGAVIKDDDDEVRAATALPGLLEEAMKSAGEAQIAKDESWKDVMAAEKLADRAGDMASAAEDLAQAEEEVAQSMKGKDDASEIAEVNGIIVAEVQKELAAIKETRKPLAGLIAKVDRLAQAEVRVEELKPQEERDRADLADLDQKLEAIPSAEDLPDPVDLTSFEERVKTAAEEETSATSAAAVAEKALADAKEAAETRAGLEDETKAAAELLSDLARLASDLGRDGLQALEIDAAGPELTDLVNDLLHGCVGTRWTVRVDTTRSSADGKRQLEGLDVMVIDTQNGREAMVETYSGGERVILGEAVSLALTTLATRRAGITGATLIRDESGAALDPENGRAYIAMLRRAADLTGASQVLYVSHTPELQELADARIHIEGGKVSVI